MTTAEMSRERFFELLEKKDKEQFLKKGGPVQNNTEILEIKLMNEINRIKDTYAKRDSSGKKVLYQLFNPAALFMNHQREKAILNALKKAGISDISSLKILDLGCGTGGVLRDFVKYGAIPQNCFGFDLLPDRIETANHISPNMNFQC